jgi:hypothetical protein
MQLDGGKEGIVHAAHDQRRTVTVLLAPSVAGTQTIGAAVDPAGDLDKALTLGRVCGPNEA